MNFIPHDVDFHHSYDHVSLQTDGTEVACYVPFSRRSGKDVKDGECVKVRWRFDEVSSASLGRRSGSRGRIINNMRSRKKNSSKT